MSEESSSVDVPVRVVRTRQPDEEETTATTGGFDTGVHHPAYRLVVPIAGDLFDPGHGVNVRRLLQTAIAIAADNDGHVRLLGIAEVGDDATLADLEEGGVEVETGASTALPDVVEQRRTQLRQVMEVVEALDPSVSVTAVVHAVADTKRGVLAAVDARPDTALLLLRGSALDRSWLFGRSLIDELLEEAECDIFVENVPVEASSRGLYVPDLQEHSVASLAETESESIDSVLLPVDDGPHSALAAEAARAIAVDAAVPVHVVHVLAPDASPSERSDAEELLSFAEYVLGADVECETSIREAEDRAEAIVEAATDHDVTVIGEPDRTTGLERLVFEPVGDQLAGQSDVTVVLCRDAAGTMRSLYYRWEQGMDAMEEGSNE